MMLFRLRRLLLSSTEFHLSDDLKEFLGFMDSKKFVYIQTDKKILIRTHQHNDTDISNELARAQVRITQELFNLIYGLIKRHFVQKTMSDDKKKCVKMIHDEFNLVYCQFLRFSIFHENSNSSHPIFFVY